jgi:hypothetical protein
MKRQIFATLLMCLSLAQLTRAQTLEITPPPRAGDCLLRFNVPPSTKAGAVTITLNSDTAPLTATITEGSPFVAALGQPLTVNSKITVTAGAATATATVQASPDGPPVSSIACPAATSKALFDDREVFEASGFLGMVFDNFAPKIDGGYANDATATRSNFRLTAGIEAQYRLIGEKNQDRQLWITAHTLHGVRSADANCADIVACEKAQGSAAATFEYIIAHASSIEAQVDARLEFLTIQKNSEVPAKVYLYGRAGFLALEGAPKVYDANSVGAGIIAPKGVFRHSYAQVGWGVSKQYDTDQSWDRLKINGVLVFDLLPNITPGTFFRDLGAGSRFFIAITIDRNVWNGPDAVQTYIGADFDLRRIFGAF